MNAAQRFFAHLRGAPIRAVRMRAAHAAAALALLGLGVLVQPVPARAAADGPRPGLMKIGIIGAGKMGGTLADLWSKAGYQVMISSRHPDELRAQAQSIGPNVSVGTPRDAAAFGDVVVIAVPYGQEPQVGKELTPVLDHKVVIDLGNPYPQRDGPMAVKARAEGTGVASARFFPQVRLVRAFNAITYVDLRADAHRADPVAIPIASDNAQATRVVSRLVRAAGYAPVLVGPLSAARRFDVGSPVYVKPMTASELRAALGLPAH